MTISPNPKVSVIIPVYNCERYLAEAIESILNQTFTDFELIIIDDASTDRSVEIARSYRDPRIRVVANERNQGVGYTANLAHELARAEYIARLDSDDVSLPHRLQVQVDFLDAHPHVALLGGQFMRIDPAGAAATEYYRPLPLDLHSIRLRAMYESPFAHSTVMYRKHILWDKLKGFDRATGYAEDYELWLRLLSANFVTHNLPDILAKYRIVPTSITHSMVTATRAGWMMPMQKNYCHYLFGDCGREQELASNFYNYLQGQPVPKRSIAAIESAIDRLQDRYVREHMDGKITPSVRAYLAREWAYLGYCLLLTSRWHGLVRIGRAIALHPALMAEIPLHKILFRSIFGDFGARLASKLLRLMK